MNVKVSGTPNKSEVAQKKAKGSDSRKGTQNPAEW